MSDALKNRLYQIIFKTETKEGRAYDIFLILSITLSTLLIIFESVDGLFYPYRNIFSFFEWFFVIIFSIEYIIKCFQLFFCHITSPFLNPNTLSI